MVTQQADGLAEGLELAGGALGVALQDALDQGAAELHAAEGQVELGEAVQQCAKALPVHVATACLGPGKPDPAQRATLDTQLPHELQVLAGGGGVAKAELDHVVLAYSGLCPSVASPRRAARAFW